MNEHQLSGLLVPVITPFLPNGELDLDSYRSYVGSLLEEDIQGIVVNGTTGESPTVSWEEVRVLFEIAREVMGARKRPILVGTGTNDTRKTVLRTEDAKRFGADGALVVVPYYSRPSQDGIMEHFRQVSAVGLPLIAYEIPARTGVRLTSDTAFSIMQLDNVIGLKDSSGSIELLQELNRRGNAKPVLCGEDALLLDMLLEGGAGGILASANAYTGRFLEVIRLVKEGRTDGAADRFERLLPYIRLVFRESNPSPIKWLLKQDGRIAHELTRLPLLGITEGLKQELAALELGQ